MATCKPHYLLFCDGCLLPSGALHTESRGRWRFVLEDIVTGEKAEASDGEPSDHLDRISLLAVTRGLEALEQPSRVTLITTSRYVARGLQYGLVEWRENDYCWEHFGSTQPIRNADLWKRVDVALRFHEVQCRWMSQESPNRDESQSAPASPQSVALPAADDACSVTVAATVGPAHPVDFALTAHSISTTIQSPTIESATTPTAIAPMTTAGPSSSAVSTVTVSIESDSKRPQVVRIESVGVPGRRLLRLGANRPLRWLWDVILAVDAFLVSCLRCLFLLDPRRDHFRSRNS